MCRISFLLLSAGDGGLLDYDSDEVDRQYEVMTLRIIHRRRCTGFEESKDFPVRHNDVIAGRYRVRLCPAPVRFMLCRRSA